MRNVHLSDKISDPCSLSSAKSHRPFVRGRKDYRSPELRRHILRFAILLGTLNPPPPGVTDRYEIRLDFSPPPPSIDSRICLADIYSAGSTWALRCPDWKEEEMKKVSASFWLNLCGCGHEFSRVNLVGKV